MLWNAIIVGTKAFSFWQTYIVGFGMMVIILFPKLFLALYQDRHKYGVTPFTPTIFWYLLRHHWVDHFETLIERATKNSDFNFRRMLVIGSLEFVGGYFGVLTLLLIMLGLSHEANWALPWILPFKEPVIFLKTVGFLLLGIILVTQVPFIGETLVYPAFVAVLAREMGITSHYFFPSFFMVLGIVAVSLIARFAIIGLFAVSTAFLPSKLVFSPLGGVGKLVGFWLMSLTSMFSGFVYAGWMTLQ